MSDIEKGKTTAIVSHLTIIGCVISIFMNQEENRSNFASFYIRQTLGIFLTQFILAYPIGYFDSWMISSAFWVFIIVLWAYSFVGCLNKEIKLVPVLGELYQQFFKNL